MKTFFKQMWCYLTTFGHCPKLLFKTNGKPIIVCWYCNYIMTTSEEISKIANDIYNEKINH